MTVFEPCVTLATLSGAIAGGMAGSAGGPIAAIGGAVAGGFASLLATVAVMAMLAGITGIVLSRQKPPIEPVPDPPEGTTAPSRLQDVAMFLFLAPVLLAPVWALSLPVIFTSVGVGREEGSEKHCLVGVEDAAQKELTRRRWLAMCSELCGRQGAGTRRTVGRVTSTGGVECLPEARRGVRHREHRGLGGGKLWNL